MCTVTLIPTKKGMLLTMNRDEQRSRNEAGLRQQDSGNCSICYPVDAQAGGTWIGLNNYGVAMALLNRYQAPLLANAKSRGHIIQEALLKGEPEFVIEYLQTLDLSNTNEFECLFVSHTKIILFTWDQKKLSDRTLKLEQGLMFTSSSERFPEVSTYRNNLFQQWLNAGKTPETIDSFHLQQTPTMASSDVFMSRKNAHTKSVVQIDLSKKECKLDYYDSLTLKANSALSHLKITDNWQTRTLQHLTAMTPA